jgi:hypothetical protein
MTPIPTTAASTSSGMGTPISFPRPMFVNAVSVTISVCPLEIIKASPENTDIVPSVVINGFTLSQTTIPPLTAPMSSAATSASSAEAQMPIPASTPRPMITVVIATTLPTETSKPPLTIRKVCAVAMMPRGAAELPLLRKLSPVKKFELSNANTVVSATSMTKSPWP